TGRQAVVDEQHRTTGHVEWRTVATIRAFASRDLLLFIPGHAIDDIGGDRIPPDYVIVQYARAAAGHGAHRQLFMAGNTQLADDEDVERRAEGTGDLERDRHAATWKRENGGGLPGKTRQVTREREACLTAIRVSVSRRARKTRHAVRPRRAQLALDAAAARKP